MVQFGWRQQPPSPCAIGSQANVLLYRHINWSRGMVVIHLILRSPKNGAPKHLCLPAIVNGGHDRTRTCKGFPGTLSKCCVYQFRHTTNGKPLDFPLKPFISVRRRAITIVVAVVTLTTYIIMSETNFCKVGCSHCQCLTYQVS